MANTILTPVPLFAITELLVTKLGVSADDVVMIWLPEETPQEVVVKLGAVLSNVIGSRFAHIIARRGQIEVEVLKKVDQEPLGYTEGDR